MKANREDKMVITSAATFFSTCRSGYFHTHRPDAFKGESEVPPIGQLWAIQLRNISPTMKPKQLSQVLGTVQRAAQSAGIHHSDISITVTISSSGWSPLAAKLATSQCSAERSTLLEYNQSYHKTLAGILSGD